MTDTSILAVHGVAKVATPEALRYLQQLCKHFGHRLPVTFDERSGWIEFPFGECRLNADEDDGLLTLSLATSSVRQLEELQDVVARHLLRFAFREPPEIAWCRAV